jgi:hypothetical protein
MIAQNGIRQHYYARMAAFDGQEELQTAKSIDGLPEVKLWVSNFPRGMNSWAIPTSGDNFCPVFVAELNEGRTFVIEHKGRMDVSAKKKGQSGSPDGGIERRKAIVPDGLQDRFCRSEFC